MQAWPTETHQWCSTKSSRVEEAKRYRSSLLTVLLISLEHTEQNIYLLYRNMFGFFFFSFFYTCLQLILARLLVAWALMNDAWSSIFECCTSMMNWVHLESSLRKNKIDSHRKKEKTEKEEKRKKTNVGQQLQSLMRRDWCTKKISWTKQQDTKQHRG